MKIEGYATIKSGFYLYTFCLYFASVVALMSMIIPLAFHFFQTMGELVKKEKKLRDVYVLFSVIEKELQNTPSKQSDLKQFNENEIVWSNGDSDVGFFYSTEKASLFKVNGIYNKEKKEWVSKKQFMITKNIIISFLSLDQENTVIRCQITLDDLVLARIISSKNHTYHKNL